MRDFVCIEVHAPNAEVAEIAAAEAFAAGAAGLEEREEGGSITLLLYVPAREAAVVARRIEALPDSNAKTVVVSPPHAVPEIDWSEAWKEGLEATVISDRLAIRPPFVPPLARVGGVDRVEIEIEPGQAFGTGGHESTQLALEWIDQVAPSLEPGARVLDVGTGSGVLSLAALALAPCTAVALDLDPLAGRAARENAERNGLGDRLQVFTGPMDALRGEPFELVVANLLRNELLPIAGAIAAATRPGGRAIFSGLLETDCARVEEALRAVDLHVRGVRHQVDANGETWAGLLTLR
jgi:ribosomal protein L11 methyltransferase